MGGKSKSASTSNTTSVSGQNGIQGDNLGTTIAGVNGSTINVQNTDYGALERASQLSELSVSQMGTVSKDAISGVTNVSNNALEQMNGLSKDALKIYSTSNSENLAMMAGLAGNQATQNASNIEAMIDLAKFKQDNGGVAQSELMTKNLAIAGITAAMVTFLVTR